MNLRLYYIEQWTDEVMPCQPTLEGWAAWLAVPDPDYERLEPAADGETFTASVIEVLGDVRVELKDGRWEAVENIPDGTDCFFLRHYEGGEGWDAEFSSDTLANATDGLDEDSSPCWFACTRSAPEVQLTFSYAEDGPRITVGDVVQ